MASFKIVALLLAALVGATSAIRLDLPSIVDATNSAITSAEEEVEGYMSSILSKDRPDKDADIVILTKFLVSPDIALDFIKAIKLVKESVKDNDGNEIYSLVKTKVDNISYYTYTAWKSYEALKDHLKSETVKKFIEFTAKEKIPIFTTPVYVIE